MKKLLVAAAVAGSALTFTALAEGDSLSANVSVTTDYVWRGTSQTDNGPAVQGGVDYTHASGAYVGIWASNVYDATEDETAFEYDIYGGYAGEAGEVGYDIGILTYNYTKEDSNAMELKVGGSFKNFSAALYNTISADDETYEGDNYIEVGVDFEKVADLFNAGVHAGYYVPAESDSDSQNDISITASKDDFSFANGHEFGLTISNSSVDGDTGETQAFVYWAKGFDF